jgi:hypothetical protein
MKRFLLCLAFLCSTVQAQAEIPVVTNPTFGDDTYVHVPLQFGFPFYGRTFTNSWMHSNGVVSFLDPAVPIEGVGYNPGQWAYCCEGIRPTTFTPQFSFMIAPLWTDLYPVGSSSFRTEGTSQYQIYQWNNIAEISNMANLNSFSLEIRPSGYIGATYSLINIQNQNTWVGTIGDATQEQWNEIYFGRGIPGKSLQDWVIDNTGVVDYCALDPLYSTSCAGYAEAYFNQQCSINPLYNPACPGYAVAYLNYMCDLDPLYSTTCQGYEQAYFQQQCTIDPLYNRECTGYAEAYALKNVVNEPIYAQKTVEVVEVQEIKAVSEPTAPVQIVSIAPAPAPVAAVVESKPAETKAETSSEKKDEPKTARQQLAERRQAAARQAAMDKAQNASEELDSATSMEAQVAVQNVVIQAMGYTPGFERYSIVMPDGVGYKPFTVYDNQKNVDNTRMLRELGSDALHDRMVNEQYR